MVQICKGLLALHTAKPAIAHRDLKLDNLLVTADGVVQLCDFGSCTTEARIYETARDINLATEMIKQSSTEAYRSPELADLYKKQLVNEKVDVWAAGCIMFTLMFFYHPFQFGGILQVCNGNYDIPETPTFSNYCLGIMKLMLTVNPAKRPETQDVLSMCTSWNAWLDSDRKEDIVLWKPKKVKKKRKHKKKPAPVAPVVVNDGFDADFDADFDISFGGQEAAWEGEFEPGAAEPGADPVPNNNNNNDTWACHQCTFILPQSALACTMCNHPMCPECKVNVGGLLVGDDDAPSDEEGDASVVVAKSSPALKPPPSTRTTAVPVAVVEEEEDDDDDDFGDFCSADANGEDGFGGDFDDDFFSG
jgi:serine/threonine protein kinase